MKGFENKNDLCFRKICSEIKTVNTVCNQQTKDLPTLQQNYLAEDIFNVDETGLFYKCLPNRTFILKGEESHGGKMSKERVTVLLCANMSGMVYVQLA